MHWFNVSCLLGAVSLYLMVTARPLSDAVIVMGLLCQRRLFHVQSRCRRLVRKAAFSTARGKVTLPKVAVPSADLTTPTWWVWWSLSNLHNSCSGHLWLTYFDILDILSQITSVWRSLTDTLWSVRHLVVDYRLSGHLWLADFDLLAVMQTFRRNLSPVRLPTIIGLHTSHRSWHTFIYRSEFRLPVTHKLCVS